MNTKKLLTTIAIASVIVFAGCKKEDKPSSGTNPIVIPVQTTVQPIINLQSDAGYGPKR